MCARIRLGAFWVERLEATPDVGLDCTLGPEGRCVPNMGGDWAAGHYGSTLWTDNPMWIGVGFEKTKPHSFHYNFTMVNEFDGYGACQFTAAAFGNFDADYIFSTYELRGSIDENGSILQPLFIDKPYE